MSKQALCKKHSEPTIQHVTPDWCRCCKDSSQATFLCQCRHPTVVPLVVTDLTPVEGSPPQKGGWHKGALLCVCVCVGGGGGVSRTARVKRSTPEQPF